MDQKEEIQDRLISVHEVTVLLGVSPATIWRFVANRSFPEPLRLGAQLRRWWLSDVDAWIEARSKASSRQNSSDLRRVVIRRGNTECEN